MAKKRKEVGLPPGSIIFTGNRKVDKINVHYLKYDEKQLEEKQLHNQEDIVFHTSSPEQVDWYDIRGLHDTQLIGLIGETFSIHPLILEDIASVNQRPKFEEYVNGNFIVLRALHFDKEKVQIQTEQVTVYFTNGLLISFQETESDLFETVRKRVKSGRGRIKERGADYLAYALIDTLVDQYFVILEEMESIIEDIEEKLLEEPDNSIKERIHTLKKEFIIVRKSIAPLREAVSKFTKSESSFIDDNTQLFVRDVYDHTIQVTDMVDGFRDLLNGLQDLYLSEISFKMNQVMQVLTIITTIFVPLSFLTGLYGMNFVNIPELQHKNGYFILLFVMVLILVASLIYFRKKKWF